MGTAADAERVDVAVVGGGITGLAAAHHLLEAERDRTRGHGRPLTVRVLEGGDRVGGAVATERTGDGFRIERGPDTMLSDKPWGVGLAERLGIDDQLIETRKDIGGGGAYVVCRGRLERVPPGFNLMAPTDPVAFLRTPILGPWGKLRAAADLILPRGRAARAGRPGDDARNGDLDDESLASFVRRRFGGELLERLAQPLVGGIYGADPERLSLAATMPRFIEAERDHRSVALGLRARRRENAREGASGARYGMFVSFADGMGTLPEALAAALGDRVQTRVPVDRLRGDSDAGYTLELGGDRPRRLHARRLLVALPAHRAASLLGDLDEDLAEALAAIPYGDAATVTFAWRRDEIPHPLDAYGFVVPSREGRALLASTWASQKWPGRAPEGQVLIRAFLGGYAHPGFCRQDDDSLVDAARRELGSLLGVTAAPRLTRVQRWLEAMPQYEVGHRRRVDRIDRAAARHPALALAGNAYRGVGIPDAIRDGERAARAILDGLGTRGRSPRPVAAASASAVSGG